VPENDCKNMLNDCSDDEANEASAATAEGTTALATFNFNISLPTLNVKL